MQEVLRLTANWKDHLATLPKLFRQRYRQLFRRRGADDGIELARHPGPSTYTVTNAECGVLVSELGKDAARLRCELSEEFDRVDLVNHLGEERRLVSRTGADFQDLVPLFQIELLQHVGNDEWLRDRLLPGDRQRAIFIRRGLARRRDESVAWDGEECLQNATVSDSAGV